MDRLTYVLSNGVKEGRVEKVLDWPGVHAAPALLSGLPLEGVWYDRTKEYLVKIKGKRTDPDRFAEPEMLTLSPLPCWSHLPPEAYRARIAKLIDQIEADAFYIRVEPILLEPILLLFRARPSRPAIGGEGGGSGGQEGELGGGDLQHRDPAETVNEPRLRLY